ncbi:hypothetical protein QYE76_021491 [Lolium multiflorum]|uniref:Tf2-1-like SH3-like domain-containing protein n=1 Tax=Lolium multiflorum TaxID=4521 RepID=A0AAD8RAS3_LOLMU|nr:hypothetical protein QYE76_021491 [Lolium multiflorum]
MAPFEALYGRKCRTPLNWSEVGESQVFGPDILREAEEKVHKIREYLKTAQSRQKSYADKRRREMTFEIGDFVYLKVSPLKGMQRFQLKGKLAPRYVGPFKVLSRRGEVSYQLELPEEMSTVHNVFHISLLRKCLEVPEKTEVFKNIDHRTVDINSDLTYREMDPIIPTEPFLQTQVYDLANGGDLIFERDLFALTDFLGRTPPVFYGGQISDNGQLQWLIMANLPGKPESPMFRQIQFSLRENTWVDGLAHALQESLARLCGQNSLAIEGERFAHFARHSSVGLPLSLPYHPVLRHHVDHLDYMLYETRSALSNSRSAANHTQQQLNQYADTIKVIAKERRTLRQLVAKRDATIHRLKTKIAVLKETISTQVEQLQILEGEGEGEDIQGDGYSYVSNDNDYEPEEEGDDDFHQHLPAGMDTTFPLRIDG